MDIETVGSI